MTFPEAAVGLIAVLIGLVAWLLRQLYANAAKDREDLRRDVRDLRERVLRLEVRREHPRQWRDAIQALEDERDRLQDLWPR